MRSSTLPMIASALAALGLQLWVGASSAAAPGPAAAPLPAGHASAAARRATPVLLIDVNSASRAQLKTLPGIGDAEADKIVAGRPYLSKADLASKQVIPTGIYLSLKSRVIAKQKGKPAGKA